MGIIVVMTCVLTMMTKGLMSIILVEKPKAVFGYVIKTLLKNRLKYVNVQMQGRFVERPVIVKMTRTTKGLMSIILVENPKAVFGYVIKTLLANRLKYVRFLQCKEHL